MKLTPKQNQVLEFLQSITDGWFHLTHTFAKQYKGEGCLWTIIYNLKDKGITERDNKKYEIWYRLTDAGKAQVVGRTKEYKKSTGPIKSTDPRKKSIVAEMKRRSGGTRVTNVKETKTHFTGRPMKKVPGCWEPLPNIAIPKGEIRWLNNEG